MYNVAFSPDNTKFAFVACKSFDKVRDDESNPYWNMTICLGNSDTGEITDELNYEGGKVLAFCLTQSAPIVADRHGIVSFNSDKKGVRIPFDPEIDGRAIVSGTAFSPDFNTIAMVYSWSRRCIRFYSVKTGKLSYEFPPLGTLEKEYMPVSEGYEEIIKFSPDSLYCAFVNGRINNTQARPPLLPASVWVFRSIISLTDALEVQLE